MKRISYVIGGLAVLAAVWSAGWYAVRLFVVEPEADRAVERMREGAFFLSYDRRDIGGFPFGYRLTYRDVRVADENGLWTWTAPWTDIAREDGQVVARSAPESRLEITAADGSAMQFDISAEALVTTMAGEGGLSMGRTEARSLTAALAGPTPMVSAAQASLAGFALDVSVADGAYSGELSADRAELAYTMTGDGVTETRSTGAFDRLSLDFALDLRNSASLPDLLEADGSVSLNYHAAGLSGRSESTGGPTSPPLTLTYQGGETGAEFELAEGRARYAANTRDMAWTAEMAPPAPFQQAGVNAAAMSVELEAPMLRTGETAPYAIDMEMETVTLSPEFWSTFDPAGALDHGPMALKVTLGGEAMVLTDFRDAMSAAPPIDLETLDITAFTLALLGARVEATGALEIAGDARRPDGVITLRTFGALKLVDDLVRAGLIPVEAAAVYRDLATQLAVPGDAEGELVSEIISRNGVVSVNGQAIAQ